MVSLASAAPSSTRLSGRRGLGPPLDRRVQSALGEPPADPFGRPDRHAQRRRDGLVGLPVGRLEQHPGPGDLPGRVPPSVHQPVQFVPLFVRQHHRVRLGHPSLLARRHTLPQTTRQTKGD